MYLSRMFFKSKRDAKSGLCESHQRLLSACFISQEASGLFRILPLGKRVLDNINEIIREEMELVGAEEVILPVLQPISIWQNSGRENYDNEMFKVFDKDSAKMVLSPTAEESVTLLVKEYLSSYKQLPIYLYQITNKYRDDLRTRYGLIRAREFLMYDSYTFDKNEEEAKNTYITYFNAYMRIFNRIGIKVLPVFTEDTGAIGGKVSHEFIIPCSIGESDFSYEDCHITDINHFSDFDAIKTSFDVNKYKNKSKGIEIGHIFLLGKKYSDVFQLRFKDESGAENTPVMGCYGIGVTRLMQAVLENSKLWPLEIAPYKLHIICNEKTIDLAHDFMDNLYENTAVAYYLDDEILIDDRDMRIGEKLNDADLIGSPIRLILGDRIELVNLMNKETLAFNTMENLYTAMEKIFIKWYDLDNDQ
jgi:prolyl-tRNA synthetase